MNSRNGKPPQARPHAQRQPLPHEQRHSPAQTAALQPKKPPAAPPVYRPQPIPKVLQRKSAPGNPPPVESGRRPSVNAGRAFAPAIQKKPSVMPPSPIRGGKSAPAAPPAYRPNPEPRVLQAKQRPGQSAPTPPTAHVRRPAPATPQAKPGGACRAPFGAVARGRVSGVVQGKLVSGVKWDDLTAYVKANYPNISGEDRTRFLRKLRDGDPNVYTLDEAKAKIDEEFSARNATITNTNNNNSTQEEQQRQSGIKRVKERAEEREKNQQQTKQARIGLQPWQLSLNEARQKLRASNEAMDHIWDGQPTFNGPQQYVSRHANKPRHTIYANIDDAADHLIAALNQEGPNINNLPQMGVETEIVVPSPYPAGHESLNGSPALQVNIRRARVTVNYLNDDVEVTHFYPLSY